MEDQPEPAVKQAPGRFLAPIGKPRDYVDRPELAVPNEPECISDGWLSNQNLWEKQHLADVEAARKLRPMLAAENRLKDAERRAKHAKRRDLKGEFLALRGMLERARQRGQPAPVSALERLERAEASLDRVPLKTAA